MNGSEGGAEKKQTTKKAFCLWIRLSTVTALQSHLQDRDNRVHSGSSEKQESTPGKLRFKALGPSSKCSFFIPKIVIENSWIMSKTHAFQSFWLRILESYWLIDWMCLFDSKLCVSSTQLQMTHSYVSLWLIRIYSIETGKMKMNQALLVYIRSQC